MVALDKLLAALHAERVEFIIVGGMAARVHGSARVAHGIDVVYSRSEQNIAHLVKALSPFKPHPRGTPSNVPFEWSAKTVKAGLNFSLQTTIGGVDLLGEITGGGRYDDLSSHSAEVDAFGHPALVVTLPWLIHLKRAAGLPDDFEAIAELELLRELSATA
jgi:hypothetical protein